MIRGWLCGVVCCGLLAVWFPVHAEECGLITNWNSNDASFFTSQEASVYAFENTSFPIPNLGGAMVTHIAFSLNGGPFTRVWHHENTAAAQASLGNYLATKSEGWVHSYGEYYLIYKADDSGMVKTMDLAANYRGSLVVMDSYFFGARSLSGELPIYESWFGQVKALIDSKCGTAGNPPTIALLPSPAQGLAFQIRHFSKQGFQDQGDRPGRPGRPGLGHVQGFYCRCRQDRSFHFRADEPSQGHRGGIGCDVQDVCHRCEPRTVHGRRKPFQHPVERALACSARDL